MNAIKNKLISRKGASITFALLIFLVCAIISGVVVVAGSTAAGRMSQIAQSDQRYYAVTSAASLLREDIDGMRVTVTYEKDTAASTPAVESRVEKRRLSAKEFKEIASTQWNEYPIVIEATKRLVTPDAMLKDDPTDPTFSLVRKDTDPSASPAGGDSTPAPDYSFLNCKVREFVRQDGRLILEVSNVTTAKATTVYTLQIIFTSKLSQTETDVRQADGTTKQIVTSTVEWKFSGIKKGALGA